MRESEVVSSLMNERNTHCEGPEEVEQVAAHRCAGDCRIVEHDCVSVAMVYV